MTDEKQELERYLAGEMNDAERQSFEREVLESDRLSDELYADSSVLVALEAAAEARRLRQARSADVRRWWRWPGMRWAVPAAAAAVVALLLVGRNPSRTPSPAVFRGAHDGLEVLFPQGRVEAPPEVFAWRRHGDVASVRFELFDADSRSRFSTVTAETTLVLHPSEVAIPDKGRWELTPLDDLRMPVGEAVTTWYEVER